MLKCRRRSDIGHGCLPVLDLGKVPRLGICGPTKCPPA
ncbi:hypothetical protein ACS15_0482 [Ralstonia insidiosa]|uniref:Uncharacterized protein n=1 Tax=Ralstonia insidiosa TaxID=190721 RepID=A0AAC9FQH4_9RALS|nr:hypothetical protein ACS15_0482 [Ralstonia insidiosa]